MKKILLFIIFICFVISGSYAQCVPDLSITANGIYPDSATGLPHAIVGFPYSTVIQTKVTLDTTAIVLGNPEPATVDSVDITSVNGLPPGFTYLCTPASCHFPGGSHACILLQGPALDASYGGQVFPIAVNVTSYGKVLGFTAPPQNSTVYRTIYVDQSVGIASLSYSKFDVAQNTPNPFKENTEIAFTVPSEELISLKVSNLLGKVVYSKTILAQKGLNRITLSSKDFNSGIYIYNIGNSKNSITRRMIVSNE